MLKGILLFLRYLPEVISFIKWISKQAESGLEHRDIKKRIKVIHRAFTNTNRAEAASQLNDAFKD